MDEMVLKTQQWLNATYGNNSGYEVIDENGQTGWTTIYALTRALQIELGITATADNFGPTTISRFNARYPSGVHQQENEDDPEDNVYAIIQGGLWCKGYSTGAGDITRHFFDGTGHGIRQLKEDAGCSNTDSTVTLHVMQALMSMNQYVTLWRQGGSDEIRGIQQALNRDYEDYVGLSPCDGLYSRQVNQALIKVLQAIEGLSPDDATGNFGDTTKARCPILPDTGNVLPLATREKATLLLRYTLACNGYSTGSYSTDWDSSIEGSLRSFQQDYVLNVTGKGDLDSWMSLLLSNH